MTPTTVDAGVELTADMSRVVAQLFLPGDSTPGSNSRTDAVIQRVLAAPPAEIAAAARNLTSRFGARHLSLVDVLRDNAAIVRRQHETGLDDDRCRVLGGAFTSELSVEGAALCNPSAVAHPDQSGMEAGQLRVVVSLRSIGESHVSSLQFCEATIGPGRAWEFSPRLSPLSVAEISCGQWKRAHFVRALERDDHVNDVVRAVVQELPEYFSAAEIEHAIRRLPEQLLHHPDSRAQLEQIRKVGRSSYLATFPASTDISQRVLLPSADEERNGIEDARFASFVDDDGRREYRGTYTAYDGQLIASRLIVTVDFRSFVTHRLTGVPALTKGMAMFPRPIGGELFALSRGDGEAVSVTRSADGFDWSHDSPVYHPSFLWDVVQSGNCGPPLETPQGWLVLTHGVGPLRSYCISAILLDLDDPFELIGVLPTPLIEPVASASDGYVPNVVYSCGGIIHDGVLWIPYGIADNRIRVASIDLQQVVDAMRAPQEHANGESVRTRSPRDNATSAGFAGETAPTGMAPTGTTTTGTAR